MLARNPKALRDKERQKGTAHKRRGRRRESLGLVYLTGDGDQVVVLNLLKGHGLLPPRTEHSYAEIQRAWQKYLDIILARDI